MLESFSEVMLKHQNYQEHQAYVNFNILLMDEIIVEMF